MQTWAQALLTSASCRFGRLAQGRDPGAGIDEALVALIGRLIEVMDWPTIITSTKDVLTAGAAIFATVTGWRALNRWQTESVGKRRLEVAGDALAGFYQMREIIKSVRAPVIYRWEMAPPDGAPDDGRPNPYYGIPNRISRHSDDIGAFFSKKHIFLATFGTYYEYPWNEINDILIKINDAADILIGDVNRISLKSHSSSEVYVEMRHVIARTEKDDQIGARIDAAIAEMEKVCRPIIGQYAPTLERRRSWRSPLGG